MGKKKNPEAYIIDWWKHSIFKEKDKRKRRGKYYSSICFQCFMFTKVEINAKILLNVESERENRLPSMSSCSFIYTTTIDIIHNSERSENLHHNNIKSTVAYFSPHYLVPIVLPLTHKQS